MSYTLPTVTAITFSLESRPYYVLWGDWRQLLAKPQALANLIGGFWSWGLTTGFNGDGSALHVYTTDRQHFRKLQGLFAPQALHTATIQHNGADAKVILHGYHSQEAMQELTDLLRKKFGGAIVTFKNSPSSQTWQGVEVVLQETNTDWSTRLDALRTFLAGHNIATAD